MARWCVGGAALLNGAGRKSFVGCRRLHGPGVWAGRDLGGPVENNVYRFLAQTYGSLDTDAVVNPGGHPHPRLRGTSPRVLGRFVRELEMVSLPDAIRNMTSQAVKIVGRRARLGRIRPGLPADVVLFEPAVADRATNEQRCQPPQGIEREWVAGRQAVERGRLVDGLVAGGLGRRRCGW